MRASILRCARTCAHIPKLANAYVKFDVTLEQQSDDNYLHELLLY